MGVELMADDQWLIFNRGGRLDAWNLGQAMTVDQVAEMVTRARLLLGIDATDDTAGVASVSPGQPHPQTLRLTTVHVVHGSQAQRLRMWLSRRDAGHSCGVVRGIEIGRGACWEGGVC